MTAGPWRPVSLEVSVANIEHVKVDYELSDDLRTANGAIHVQTRGSCNRIEASLYFGETNVLPISGAVDAEGKANLPFTVGK